MATILLNCLGDSIAKGKVIKKHIERKWHLTSHFYMRKIWQVSGFPRLSQAATSVNRREEVLLYEVLVVMKRTETTSSFSQANTKHGLNSLLLLPLNVLEAHGKISEKWL